MARFGIGCLGEASLRGQFQSNDADALYYPRFQQLCGLLGGEEEGYGPCSALLRNRELSVWVELFLGNEITFGGRH